MAAGNLTELNVLLEQSKNNLENQMDSGEIPVVGWTKLSKLLEGCKNPDEIEIELREVEKQINSLREKKGNLEKELKIRKEGQSLKSKIIKSANLAGKEKQMIEQFNEKIDNLQNLDVKDVSTLFSQFNLDHLFLNYKHNESKFPSYAIVDTIHFDNMKSGLELELNEALEMFSKFQLVKEGIKSFDDHIAKCRICQNKNALVLLREYGADLNDEEKKIVQDKTKDWKGYFLISDPITIAQVLDLPPTLTPKVAGAVRQIKGRHHSLFCHLQAAAQTN